MRINQIKYESRTILNKLLSKHVKSLLFAQWFYFINKYPPYATIAAASSRELFIVW